VDTTSRGPGCHQAHHTFGASSAAALLVKVMARTTTPDAPRRDQVRASAKSAHSVLPEPAHATISSEQHWAPPPGDVGVASVEQLDPLGGGVASSYWSLHIQVRPKSTAPARRFAGQGRPARRTRSDVWSSAVAGSTRLAEESGLTRGSATAGTPCQKKTRRHALLRRRGRSGHRLVAQRAAPRQLSAQERVAIIRVRPSGAARWCSCFRRAPWSAPDSGLVPLCEAHDKDETRYPTSRECGVSRDEHRDGRVREITDLDALRRRSTIGRRGA